jgi:hypothetical protein
MNKKLLLLALGAVTVMAAACSRAPSTLAVTPVCAAASDSLSKYVSRDALPLARLLGPERTLPAPPELRFGDSVIVEFLVLPDGRPDAGSMEVAGTREATFHASALRFLGVTRFEPGRVGGCGVLSKYKLRLFAPQPR